MKHKVAELEGGALDAAAAKALGAQPYYGGGQGDLVQRWRMSSGWPVAERSTDWAQGGPIIERERISLNASDKPHKRPAWEASINEPDDGAAVGYGPTPLIAAMRAYTISKLGEEVDL